MIVCGSITLQVFQTRVTDDRVWLKHPGKDRAISSGPFSGQWQFNRGSGRSIWPRGPHCQEDQLWIHEMATYSGAGSSTDAAPPRHWPFLPQTDMPTDCSMGRETGCGGVGVGSSEHMDETLSSDENSRMVAHEFRRGRREDPDRWLEDHSSGSLWGTSGLAGDAERISAGVEARTPTKEEIVEGISVIARDAWMMYRRSDCRCSKPSWWTSWLAGDAERIAKVARTESDGSCPPLVSDSPRNQQDPYPVHPPPADPLPPPEDSPIEEEQPSEYSEYENDVASADEDMLTNDGGSEANILQRLFFLGRRVSRSEANILQRAFLPRQAAAVRTGSGLVSVTGRIQVTDATGRTLSEEEIHMWGRVVRQNAEHEARYQYVEARRRQMDTESNWSTNAVAEDDSMCVPQNWAYVFNSPDETWEEARERDSRWSGFDYKAAHFTWTHKCYGSRNCSWSTVSQNEISCCGRCFSEWIGKYPTFNGSWRTVSQWYFTGPCDRWYFFCTRCNEFSSDLIHCGHECVDVLALKNDHSFRCTIMP